MVRAYFFFAFLVAFLAGFAFFVAITLTTFHAVRDLPVAHSWHNTPESSGIFEIVFGVGFQWRDGC